MKTCVITGASSGIGMQFAKKFDSEGYHIVLVSRNEEKLLKLKNELKSATYFLHDLTKDDECLKLLNELKQYKVDVFINNAGFGKAGYFDEGDIEDLKNIVDLNSKAVTLLTYGMINQMKDLGGTILNVSSIAGILPAGPFMSSYYATKNYVRSLTEGIDKELKIKKSKVKVKLLCPGPVDTNFNNVANVKFKLKGISAKKCVDYTYKRLFKRKLYIIPGFNIRMLKRISKIVPRKILISLTAKQQEKKL